MRGVLAGLGAREILERGGAGSVMASFRAACYVEVGGAQVALVAPGVHAGPVHLVLDEDPPRPDPGRPVHVGAGELVVDGTTIDVAGAADWCGSLPAAPAVLEHASTIAAVAAEGARRSALWAEPFAEPAARARVRLDDGRLEEAARMLGGLGPGLTPSGDDALTGIVFGLRAALGPGIEPLAIRACEAAGVGAFGRVALAFAARGQVLAPVHALVSAIVGGNVREGRAAARAVAAVGETSGADLLGGLGWAFSEDAVYAVAASEGLEMEPAASAR
jgi:hypothetical protein